RKRPLHQVALLGLLLVPFLFYPSNYYCHFVFLLPLALAPEDQPLPPRDRNFGWTVLILCAMCVGQFATYSEGWTDLRYTYQSFVLLIGFLAIMVPLAAQSWHTLRPPRVVGAPAGGDPAPEEPAEGETSDEPAAGAAAPGAAPAG